MTRPTDIGSAHGSMGTISKSRLLEDNRVHSKRINPKTIPLVQLLVYSFPVPHKELLFHLQFLSAVNMKTWMAVITCLLFGSTLVAANCPEPNVMVVYGVVVPVIHPCNSLVELTRRGIGDLRFAEVYAELRDLNVSFNRIENIQTNLFHGMTSLETLDMSNNNLITVREGNFNGSVIELLSLSNNQIEVLLEGAFEGLGDTLRFLNLTFNHLWSLRKGVFTNLRHVTVLDISFNHLSIVHPDAFKGMDHLLMLKLQGNQLTVVSGWLPPVSRQLDLSFNNITTTEGVPQDATIDVNLSNNPLTCSQENEEFSKWCSQTENCRGPKDLEARCDSIELNSDRNAKPHNCKPKEESHTTNVPSARSEGRQPYASGVLVIVVSLLVGY